MIFLNQIGYRGWGSNGLICRLYSLVSPVLIQIIMIFKILSQGTWSYCSQHHFRWLCGKRWQTSSKQFYYELFFNDMFFNPSLFLYFPLPFPRSPVRCSFFFFLLFHPVFCLFPRCGAWSQAIATALRILVNIKIRNIYLVGERC